MKRKSVPQLLKPGWSPTPVLLANENTSKEEAAGLAAHLHITLQLYQDLGGNRYDAEFCEWAAAKDIYVWGKNMSIYGRRLPQP